MLQFLPFVCYTVELQWLEYLLDDGKLFETWVVRATEGNHGAMSGSKKP